MTSAVMARYTMESKSIRIRICIYVITQFHKYFLSFDRAQKNLQNKSREIGRYIKIRMLLHKRLWPNKKLETTESLEI